VLLVITVPEPKVSDAVILVVCVAVTVPAVARPPVVPLPTVATDVADDFQVAVVVSGIVVPSDSVPLAVNWKVPPECAIAALLGVTVMLTRLAGVTVTLAVAVSVPAAAVMLACPVLVPAVTRPPVLVIPATVVSDDCQLAETADVVPSLKVAIADIC
jgi:hypothetical protein